MELSMLRQIKEKHGEVRAEHTRQNYMFTNDSESAQFFKFVLMHQPDLVRPTDLDYFN